MTILRYISNLCYEEYMNGDLRQPRETSRDRRARETRAALLESAYETFCEQGFAAASLDAIAARAGFTRGALYKNFPTKEDLFVELAATRAESLFDEWRTVTPESHGTEKAGWAVGSWLGDAIRSRGAWFLANAEFTLTTARNPDLAERHRAALRQANRELGALLHRFGARTDDEEALGQLAMTMIDGFIFQAAIDPDLDVSSRLATGLERLLRGAESPT